MLAIETACSQVPQSGSGRSSHWFPRLACLAERESFAEQLIDEIRLLLYFGHNISYFMERILSNFSLLTHISRKYEIRFTWSSGLWGDMPRDLLPDFQKYLFSRGLGTIGSWNAFVS